MNKRKINKKVFYTKNIKEKLTEEQMAILNKEMKNSSLDLDKIILRYRNMYYRCYSENNHKSHPYNETSTICDQWLDESEGLFNFAMWCLKNYYEIEGEETLHLDKDILVKGNTVYSPDTCCFVPARINSMFSRSGKNDKLPKGVAYSKSTGKYKPYVEGFDGKKVKNIGWYDTVEEAWNVYAMHRKAWITVVADMYKDTIPTKLYDAMINWKIEITD